MSCHTNCSQIVDMPIVCDGPPQPTYNTTSQAVCYQPCAPNGWSYPNALAPLHKFWGDRHTDVNFETAPQDGEIAVFSSATNKWILTGSNNLNAGLYTKSGSGSFNLTLGFNAASSELTKASVVAGNNNVIAGAMAGTTSIAGSNNIAIGNYAGISLNNGTVCLGQFAGTSTIDPYNNVPIQAGSNNIFINASGTALHSTETDRCYIKPIRRVFTSSGDPWPTLLPTNVVPLGLNLVTNEVVSLEDTP